MSWVNSGAVNTSGSDHAAKVFFKSVVVTVFCRSAPKLKVTPTERAMATHASARSAIPTITRADEVCSIRAITEPNGKSEYGLLTTGNAPAPRPPSPISSVATVPSQRRNRNLRCCASVGETRGGNGAVSSCSCAEREPAVPIRGSTARIGGQGFNVRKFTKTYFSHNSRQWRALG